MTNNRILITGGDGQDGQICRSILENQYGCSVTLVVRDNAGPNRVICDFYDSENVKELINGKYDYIFHFAGQNSVGKSYEDPSNTISFATSSLVNLCEAIRLQPSKVNLILPLSTEMYGNYVGEVSERTPLNPISPYGLSKKFQLEIANFYKKYKDLNIFTPILTNHESKYRKPGFVTRKIIDALKNFEKDQEKIKLGDTSVVRDWCCAQEVCETMIRLAFNNHLDPVLIASGESASLQKFIDIACEMKNIQPSEIFDFDKSLLRQNEIKSVNTDVTVLRALGLPLKRNLRDLVESLLVDD